MRAATSLILAAALGAAGCTGGGIPAGGLGPFDPPPAPRAAPSPAAGSPSGAPRSAMARPMDPGEELARDVEAALAATAPGQGDGSAQSAASAMPGPDDMGIIPNAESIDLSQFSQEEQIRQREAAARRREAARQQLEIVQPGDLPPIDPNANVVAFARETTHPVGTRRYDRPFLRDRLQARGNCRAFDTAEQAQRQFLAYGGPQDDRFNLDPDGDGFACGFDPEKYRQLQF